MACYHQSPYISQAPNDEVCNLFTIPAAAVQTHIKSNSVAKKERVRATVDASNRAALGEMLDTETFKCKTGYIIKNGSNTGKWMSKQKQEKQLDPEKENKKTGEAWLKKLIPYQS